MGMKTLQRLAIGAAPAVKVICGKDMVRATQALQLDTRIRITDSPRQAHVLLVAGDIGDRIDALELLHDQLPHPRTTLWWRRSAVKGWPGLRVADDDDVGDAVLAAWAGLMNGERASEVDRLADEPPVAWRGVGPHGQGGKGMMGGTPYGRGMAMTADDLRDGLSLDTYTARVGPFLSGLPDGLQLEITLQGDVVQSVHVLQPPLVQESLVNEPLLQAATILRLLELPVLAERCIRSVVHQHRPPRRLLRFSGALRAIPPNLCRLPDGSDARARFERWVGASAAAESTTPELDRISQGDEPNVSVQDLLKGLEWHEAMLAIASLPLTMLVQLCNKAIDEQARQPAQDEETDS